MRTIEILLIAFAILLLSSIALKSDSQICCGMPSLTDAQQDSLNLEILHRFQERDKQELKAIETVGHAFDAWNRHDHQYYVFNGNIKSQPANLNSISIKDISCTFFDLQININEQSRFTLTVKCMYLKAVNRWTF